MEVSGRINIGSYWIQHRFLPLVLIFNHKHWGFFLFFLSQLRHMGRLQLAHRKLSQANSEIPNKASLPTCWHTAPEGNISSGSLGRFKFLGKHFILHCFSVSAPGSNSIKSSFFVPFPVQILILKDGFFHHYALNPSLHKCSDSPGCPDRKDRYVWFWRGSLPGQGSFSGPPVFNLDQLDIWGRVLHARVARLFSSLCGNSLAVLCSEEYPSRVFLHIWSFYWVNLSSLLPQDPVPTCRLCQEPLAIKLCSGTLPTLKTQTLSAQTLPWIQLQHISFVDTWSEMGPTGPTTVNA